MRNGIALGLAVAVRLVGPAMPALTGTAVRIAVVGTGDDSASAVSRASVFFTTVTGPLSGLRSADSVPGRERSICEPIAATRAIERPGRCAGSAA